MRTPLRTTTLITILLIVASGTPAFSATPSGQTSKTARITDANGDTSELKLHVMDPAQEFTAAQKKSQITFERENRYKYWIDIGIYSWQAEPSKLQDCAGFVFERLFHDSPGIGGWDFRIGAKAFYDAVLVPFQYDAAAYTWSDADVGDVVYWDRGHVGIVESVNPLVVLTKDGDESLYRHELLRVNQGLSGVDKTRLGGQELWEVALTHLDDPLRRSFGHATIFKLKHGLTAEIPRDPKATITISPTATRAPWPEIEFKVAPHLPNRLIRLVVEGKDYFLQSVSTNFWGHHTTSASFAVTIEVLVEGKLFTETQQVQVTDVDEIVQPDQAEIDQQNEKIKELDERKAQHPDWVSPRDYAGCWSWISHQYRETDLAKQRQLELKALGLYMQNIPLCMEKAREFRKERHSADPSLPAEPTEGDIRGCQDGAFSMLTSLINNAMDECELTAAETYMDMLVALNRPGYEIPSSMYRQLWLQVALCTGDLKEARKWWEKERLTDVAGIRKRSADPAKDVRDYMDGTRDWFYDGLDDSIVGHQTTVPPPGGRTINSPAGRTSRSLITDPQTQELRAAARKRHSQGRLAFRERQWSVAEKHYRAAIRHDPDYSVAHANLAGALWQQGRKQEARESAQTARSQGVEGHWLFNTLSREALEPATALNRSGEFAQAAAAYREALRWDPGNASALSGLGNALFALRRYEEAEAMYRQAIMSKPEVGIYHANLAGALWKQQKVREAKAAAQQGVGAGCESHWVYQHLGIE